MPPKTRRTLFALLGQPPRLYIIYLYTDFFNIQISDTKWTFFVTLKVFRIKMAIASRITRVAVRYYVRSTVLVRIPRALWSWSHRSRLWYQSAPPVIVRNCTPNEIFVLKPLPRLYDDFPCYSRSSLLPFASRKFTKFREPSEVLIWFSLISRTE